MPNKVPSLPYGDPKVNNQGQPQPRQISDVFSAENIARAYSDIDNFIAERAPQIEQGILADRQRRINQSRVDMFKPKDFNPSGPNVPLFQSELVGNSMSGPNPALYNSTMSNVDRVNQQIEMTRWNNQFNVDPNITSRIATFNGGKGVYDFNRFSTHPNFKQLGFSVYRDNENLYNEKSTWFDDFRRMTSTFDNLVGHAVLSTAGNWGFTGEGDSSDAREQQAMIQRASSTRPGFGSKVTNFGANAAYTIGIGVEILAENLLIKAASRFMPAIQAAHAPRNAMLTARFGKALYSLFKSIKPVNEARKVWSTINTSGKLASAIGRGALNLVPGYETGKFLYGALKSGTAINRLSTLSKVKGTFGAFYRDAREINLVTSEARLEGGGAQIAFTDKAVEEFRKKNGRFPNAEEGAAINALAVKANFDAGYQNMAAIYISNKIMFGDMLKGIPGARRMMKSNALNSTLFKIVNNPNWKKLGLAGPLSYAKKGLFADMKRTVFSKEWLKSVPSQMGNMFTGKALSGLGSRITGRGLRYFAGNITEGLQESFQEAVQFGAVDYYLKEYYKDLYGDPIIAAHNSMTRSILKGVEEQFSAQGLEVFLNGFFMGGMMQTAQSTLINPASRLLGSASDKIFKKTDYAEYVASEKERFESFTKAYNDIAANTQEYVSFFEDNLKQQKDLRNLSRMYEDVGETSDAVTARQDAMYKHIYTMLQTGHYDTLLDALNDFSQLNDQELAEAFPDDVDSTDRNKKTKHQRLQNVIKYAQEIKQDYEDSLKIENPYNPDLYDKSSNPSGYADELRGYRGVEFARSLLVFNKFSSRRTLERMESIFNNYFSNSKLGGTGSLDLSILFDYHGDPKKFQDYENTLKLEIAALSSSPEAADKKKADIKLNQLNNLRNLMDRVFEFRTIQNIISKAGVREGDAKYVKDLAADIRKEKAAIISSTSAVDPDGKIKPDEDTDSIADDVIITQYLKETLSEAYRDYLKSVYEVNGITPEDTTIDDSFEEFFDFTKLGTEYKRNAAHLNLLANPLSLMELAERYKAAVGAVEAEFTRLHTEAYEKFVTYLSESKFLQKLDDLGIYFNPDSVESFLKDDILPDAFIDKETGKIIRADDPRYEQIIDLIEEHELETGKTFKNKPKAFTPAPATPPVATPPAPTSAATPTPPASTTPTPAGSTSTGDPLAAYPADIQEKLKEAYAKSGVRVPITEWIKTSPKAATIIKGPAKKKKKPSSKEGLISETNPKTITNKLIETIYTIFKPFFTAGMKPKYVLNSDESAYVNTENINEEIERVSTIKGVGPEDSLILRRQSSRGNIIDDRLRSFATPLTAEGLSLKDLIINAHIEYERTGDPSELDAARTELRKYVSNIVRDAKTLSTPLNISDGFVDQFTQILEDLALEFRDYTWYTSMPAMVGSFLGSKYAGTVDLILEKDGKYTIVDFKTSEVIRRSRPDLYKVSDQIQQNAYREAFLQNTGENPDMAILNFVITTANDKKDITSVKLDKYKNTEGEMSVLIPVKEMSVLQAKIEQLNVEKNKELSQIEKNASFDNKTKAELKKAVEEKYAAEINELEVKSKAESEKPPVAPAATTVSGKKADVILPIGTSGSGKSTFIKSLPQENLVVISPDEMRVEFTGDINDKSKDKEIYEESAKRAIQAIKDGKQVVFDTTNLTKEKRRPFIEAIKKAIPGANIQYKLMELNPELAKQRIKAQIARGENRANVSDETIDRHAESYKQMLEDIKSEDITPYDATPAAAPVSDKKADIVQTYEYKGKTQTIKKQTSTKDGITKVTFVGERSDKPGVVNVTGYVYGGVTSNPVQQFFDDYGVTVEDIAEDLSINDIKAIKVIEERTGEGITAITFRITFSEEMGGVSSEPMEMAVKKQKFTSDVELDALEGAKPAESKVEVISENYTPELLRANPNKLFLFGDNNTRTGKGGQAVIRDEPNAVALYWTLNRSV